MLLLIDNCTLLQLVYSDAYSGYLIELENLVNGGNISLITHKLILEEWAKHRPIDKERKHKKLLKRINKVKLQPDNSLPVPVSINYEHLDLQYEQIDRLLKAAKVIDTPEVIHTEFSERFRKNLAPFHKDRNSQNDWEIFGSVANYCLINGADSLYFISSNTNQFADEEEPARKIHPELESRFSGLRIIYYRDYSDFIENMNQSILPEKMITGSILRNERFSYKASASKHLLDSLHYLFNSIYDEVGFVPIHILIKYYAFVPKRYQAHQSVFTIANVRDELVTLFDSVEIQSDKIKIIDEKPFQGVSDYENKIEFVLSALTRNLIFNLVSEKTNHRVRVRYHSARQCDCVQCSFLRLELHKSLKALSYIETDILNDKLKIAYYNYQFGNYRTAVEQHLSLRDEARQKKKYIIYFICQHNLRHLGSFLKNPFYNYGFSNEDIENLTSIDTLEEAVKLKSYSDYDFLSFITQGVFFKDAFETISELSVKIEDHYYSHLKGGWGSNSFVWQMIAEFASLDSFINNNFIIYDGYSNFDRLFALFTKGLFASYALKETQSSSIEHFDDYLVARFIFYGDKKTIYRYYNRYNLKTIEYSPTSKNSFTQLAANFFKNGKDTRKELLRQSDKVNGQFQTKYSSIFDNIVTMGAILDLPETTISTFADQLINFIKKESWLNFLNYDSVESFIHLKGNLLSEELLDKYFQWFLLKIDDRQAEVLIAIVTRTKGKKLIIGDLGPILYQSLDHPDRNIRIKTLEFVYTYFKYANAHDRNLITQRFNTSLKKSFDYVLYYRAAIHDIIKIRKSDVVNLLNEIDLSRDVYTFQSMLSGQSSKFINRLDDIINLCFKANIKTNLPEFQRFKSYNPYYEWLLNMNNFNYENFDWEWLTHHRTKYYFGEMKKCKILKDKLIEYLKRNNDSRLQEVLVNIL